MSREGAGYQTSLLDPCAPEWALCHDSPRQRANLPRLTNEARLMGGVLKSTHFLFRRCRDAYLYLMSPRPQRLTKNSPESSSTPLLVLFPPLW